MSDRRINIFIYMKKLEKTRKLENTKTRKLENSKRGNLKLENGKRGG